MGRAAAVRDDGPSPRAPVTNATNCNQAFFRVDGRAGRGRTLILGRGRRAGEDGIVQPYLNLDRRSRVLGYELGGDYLDVYFQGTVCYRYTALSVGLYHLSSMKALARLGRGLHRYIEAHPAVRTGHLARLA
jgi:hypothetical protein